MASAYMFSHYWPGDGVGGTPPPATGSGYSPLHYGLTAGVVVLWWLVALLQPPVGAWALAALPLPWPVLRSWLLAAWARLRPWVWRHCSLRVRLLWVVADLLYRDDAFTRACLAVQHVAVEPGMRERRVWGEIGQRVGQVPGVGENVFRHLAATEYFGAQPFGRLHHRNLLLELAYVALKDKIRRG